jgi:hypothetical protein
MKKRAPISVQKAAEHWQRCRQEDLPRAFYAYDSKEQQGERVVSYRLQGDDLQKLIAQAEKGKEGFKFVVHLGLYPGELNGTLTDEPAFALYLQVYEKEGDWQNGCIELNWAANSRFSTNMDSGSRSGKNAIPSASAYLFIYSWLEKDEPDLALPFTAASRVMGQRVKAYIFSPAESRSILLDLQASTQDYLEIHLGNGLAVWDHPFSFRPVMDVPGVVPKGESRKQPVPVNATGLTDDDGDSYYDFGMPHPPGKP